MVGDPDGRLGLRDVVQLLRDDIRDARHGFTTDLAESEQRVMKRIEATGDSFLTYQSEHIGVHNRRSEDTDRVHKELASRIDAMTIVEARRAGSLAVVLLVIRTVGTHWQALAVLVALIGLLLGRIDLTVVGPVP